MTFTTPLDLLQSRVYRLGGLVAQRAAVSGVVVRVQVAGVQVAGIQVASVQVSAVAGVQVSAVAGVQVSAVVRVQVRVQDGGVHEVSAARTQQRGRERRHGRKREARARKEGEQRVNHVQALADVLLDKHGAQVRVVSCKVAGKEHETQHEKYPVGLTGRG